MSDNSRASLIGWMVVGLGAVILLFVLPQLFYTVRETEQVIITEFGRPVGNAVTDPGLHMKKPFLQRVHRFDKRFLEWDGDPNDLPTKDKVFIFVDTYARWRITDPLLFFQRVRDEAGAQTRLDDILDGATRDAVAKHALVEVVRSTNRKEEAADPAEDESVESQTGSEPTETLDPIATGRSDIQAKILQEGQARAKDFGIEILDLRFKRINYGKSVEQKVYERMSAERQVIADRYISEGEGEASRILGTKEKELQLIQSEAYQKAEEIRGKADGEAAKIYAEAYNLSSDRRSLYAFLQKLELLKDTVDKDTNLLLSTKGELGELLKDAPN